MFYVYILLLSNGKHYVGHTNNLTRRFLEHNQGQCKSTRYFRPLVLKYSEKATSRHLARRREVYIKNRGATRFLRKKAFATTVV